jgi:hypothetical protein
MSETIADKLRADRIARIIQRRSIAEFKARELSYKAREQSTVYADTFRHFDSLIMRGGK